MKNNKIINALKWLWLIAVVVFIGYYFYKHLPEEIEYFKAIAISRVLLAALLIAIAKMFVVEMARFSITNDKWRPSYLRMFTIVTVTQLGKYIPGSIWHFAARISSYKENSLSNKKTAKAMLLENAWLVGSALAFGLLLLTIERPEDLLTKYLGITLPAALWAILPFVVIVLWLVGLVVLDKFLLDKKTFSLSRLVRLVLIQVAIWGALGSSFYLIFQGAMLQHFLLILGGYVVSWMVGYVFIFAPSGIGVREAVLVALFSTIVPTQQIAAYSIVHRLIYTVVEVLLGLIGFILQRRFFPAEPASSTDEKQSGNLESPAKDL
ncbi:MAG: YbhN family protein [Anaerolineaceae bacterium]|nr:YbhN family protein [Anaerolineaceae bacterium]